MKIIVYDDSPEYGGHQAMACYGIEALTDDPSREVVFLYQPKNRMLSERLSRIGQCRTIESPCETRRLQGLRNHLDHRGIARLAKQFTDLQGDLVLCIQGDSEQSSQALLAARRAEIRCVSYIALPHTMKEMGTAFGTLRDWSGQHCINLPDRFITISEGMRKKLVARGCSKPIDVIPNGIPIPAVSQEHKKSTDRSPCTLGVAGRIEFKQKRQDFVVEAFKQHPAMYQDCHLLIAGHGPDERILQGMTADMDSITLLPWQQDMNSFYDQIDLLVIPSRYEGVPLVMLEALARGIPVVGSAVDGMREFLPADWLFETGSTKSLAQTVARVRKHGQGAIGPIQQRVIKEHSLEAFKARFVDAVRGLLD